MPTKIINLFQTAKIYFQIIESNLKHTALGEKEKPP